MSRHTSYVPFQFSNVVILNILVIALNNNNLAIISDACISCSFPLSAIWATEELRVKPPADSKRSLPPYHVREMSKANESPQLPPSSIGPDLENGFKK